MKHACFVWTTVAARVSFHFLTVMLSDKLPFIDCERMETRPKKYFIKYVLITFSVFKECGRDKTMHNFFFFFFLLAGLSISLIFIKGGLTVVSTFHTFAGQEMNQIPYFPYLRCIPVHSSLPPPLCSHSLRWMSVHG